jgi:hypothetical protein
MLALGSTPTLAQETAAAAQQPVIVLPPVTPAPAPAPAPTVQAPVLSSPVAPVTPPVVAVPVEPVAEAPAPRPAAQRAAAPAPRAATAPAPRAAPAAVAPDTSVTNAGEPLATDTAAPVASEPLPEALPLPVEAAPQEATAGGQDWTALIALALAGIIPLAFAVFAFMWFRRRSRRTGYVPMQPVERPVERAPRGVTAEPASASLVDHAPYVPATAAATTPVPVMAMSPAQSRTSGEVILPREMPQTFAERDRLLRKMIAAKPDRANPFRAPKARARRARLILQSLGRKFDDVTPRFDLSQYGYIWPHLAKPQHGFA